MSLLHITKEIHMTTHHERAVEQLMRRGRVQLRDRENGNLYVSNQWDGTYKILEWDDASDVDDHYEVTRDRGGALEEIAKWFASLEKIRAL